MTGVQTCALPICDNVVGALCEFPSNVYPWMALARRGVEYRQVPEREGRIDLDGPTRDVFARLAQDDAAARLGLQAPAITRFSARWGQTLLTVEEVKQALRKRS